MTLSKAARRKEQEEDLIRAQALRRCLESLDGTCSTSEEPDKLRNELSEAVRRYFKLHPQIVDALVGVAVSGMVAGRLAASSRPLPGSVNRLAPISQCAVERRFLLAGAKPARQLSLQPVAVGAVHRGNDMD